MHDPVLVLCVTALPDVPLYDSSELLNVTTVGSVLQPVYNQSRNVCQNAVSQVRTLLN
jgi:hypothetical protein